MGTWWWLHRDGWRGVGYRLCTVWRDKWRPRWYLTVHMRWDYDPTAVEAAMSNEKGWRRDVRKRSRSATKDAAGDIIIDGHKYQAQHENLELVCEQCRCFGYERAACTKEQVAQTVVQSTNDEMLSEEVALPTQTVKVSEGKEDTVQIQNSKTLFEFGKEQVVNQPNKKDEDFLHETLHGSDEIKQDNHTKEE
ncbi:hypothetical protein HN51_035332 [Arachis hypogaea]